MEIATQILCLIFGMILAGGAFVAPANRHNSKPLITAYAIVWVLFIIYFLLPGAMLIFLRDSRYIWIPSMGGSEGTLVTTALCIFAYLTFAVSYRFSLGAKRPAMARPLNAKIVKTTSENHRLRRRRSNSDGVIIAKTLIVLGVLLKISAVIIGGGVSSTIIRMSHGVSNALGEDTASPIIGFLRSISGVAEAGATWLLLYRLSRGERFRSELLISIAVCILSFLIIGKRLFLIWPLLIIGLSVHFFVKPLRQKLLPLALLGVIGIGFASLMFRIFLPAFFGNLELHAEDASWSNGSLLGFYLYSLEYASYESLSLCIFDANSIVSKFGTSIEAFFATNIKPIAYFIPRFIWPSKPLAFYDISHAIYSVIFRVPIEDSPGVAATILGTSWVVAGPIGLFVSMCVTGLFAGTIDRRLYLPDRRISPRLIIVLSFALMVLFHLFRQGTIAWTAIIVIGQHYGMILGFVGLDFFSRASADTAARPPRTNKSALE